MLMLFEKAVQMLFWGRVNVGGRRLNLPPSPSQHTHTHTHVYRCLSGKYEENFSSSRSFTGGFQGDPVSPPVTLDSLWKHFKNKFRRKFGDNLQAWEIIWTDTVIVTFSNTFPEASSCLHPQIFAPQNTNKQSIANISENINEPDRETSGELDLHRPDVI